MCFCCGQKTILSLADTSLPVKPSTSYSFFFFLKTTLWFILAYTYQLNYPPAPQLLSLRTFAPKHRVHLPVICCFLIVVSLRAEDQPPSQHGGRAPADAPCFLNVELIQEAGRHGGWLVVAWNSRWSLRAPCLPTVTQTNRNRFFQPKLNANVF